MYKLRYSAQRGTAVSTSGVCAFAVSFAAGQLRQRPQLSCFINVQC